MKRNGFSKGVVRDRDREFMREFRQQPLEKCVASQSPDTMQIVMLDTVCESVDTLN